MTARVRSRLARITFLRAVAVMLLLSVAVTANLVVVALIIWHMLGGDNGADWRSWMEAGRRAFDGAPVYAWERGVYEFRYSPLMAYAFGILAPLGIVGWRVLSLASLLLLPRRLAVVALLSIPLWLDLYAGNVMTMLFVISALALLGGQLATGAFFVALFLVPKPLLLPLAAWLLWQRPKWRRRVLILALINVTAVMASGQATAWASSFVSGQYDIYEPFELGPARFIGLVWIPIGALLSIWLTRRHRLGYASLAASPFWLPYYLIMLLLELVPKRDFSIVRELPLVPTRNQVG